MEQSLIPIIPIKGTYRAPGHEAPLACTAVGIATDGVQPEFVVIVTVPISRLTYIDRTAEFTKDSATKAA